MGRAIAAALCLMGWLGMIIGGVLMVLDGGVIVWWVSTAIAVGGALTLAMLAWLLPPPTPREGPLVELAWFCPGQGPPRPIAYLVEPQQGDAELAEDWMDAIRRTPHLLGRKR